MEQKIDLLLALVSYTNSSQLAGSSLNIREITKIIRLYPVMMAKEIV